MGATAEHAKFPLSQRRSPWDLVGLMITTNSAFSEAITIITTIYCSIQLLVSFNSLYNSID